MKNKILFGIILISLLFVSGFSEGIKYRDNSLKESPYSPVETGNLEKSFNSQIIDLTSVKNTGEVRQLRAVLPTPLDIEDFNNEPRRDDPPVCDFPPIELDEDTEELVLIIGRDGDEGYIPDYCEDPDGDELEFGGFWLREGAVRYDYRGDNGNIILYIGPAQENWNGLDRSLRVFVRGGEEEIPYLIEVIVHPVNDPPVCNIPNFEILRNIPRHGIDLNWYCGDVDGDRLIYEVVEENVNEVNCEIDDDNLMNLIPAEDWDGETSCTIRADDGHDEIIEEEFGIIVSPFEHTINLNLGWNLISSYLVPNNLDIEIIFNELVEEGSLILVKDSQGRFYYPERDFNNIPEWNPQEAYYVKVNRATTFTIQGIRYVNPRIEIHEGWNYVAYPRTESYTMEDIIEEVLAPLGDSLIMIKDDRGRFYLPEYNFNNIPRMEPGRGYMIKVSEDVMLNLNQAPVWVDVPERVREGRGGLIEFLVRGEDPNGDELTIELSDQGGIRDGEEFEFIDHGDGTGTFRWQLSPFSFNGNYRPVFTLSDGEFEVDAEVLIIVIRRRIE